MLTPFRRYADFAGRSPRGEFWSFVLFLCVATWVLTIADAMLGFGGVVSREWIEGDAWTYAASSWSGGLLTKIFAVATIIPSLAVSARRLHDANHSGLWLLLLFVPGLGWLILLIFFLQRSWPIANHWG